MSTKDPKPWEPGERSAARLKFWPEEFPYPWESSFDIDAYCQRFASVRVEHGLIPDMAEVLRDAMLGRIRELEEELANVKPVLEWCYEQMTAFDDGWGTILQQSKAPEREVLISFIKREEKDKGPSSA
jgi:hypothetical protein